MALLRSRRWFRAPRWEPLCDSSGSSEGSSLSPASVLESGLECLGLNQLQSPRAEVVGPRNEASAPEPGAGSKQLPEWPPGVANAGGGAAPCGEPVRAAEAVAAARRGETFGKATPGLPRRPTGRQRERGHGPRST